MTNAVYFEHPNPLLVEICWGWALQGHSGAGHSEDTTLWGWALQGDCGVGHLGGRWLGTPGRLWGEALQGHSRVGHSRDTLGLGTPGMSEEKSSGGPLC